MPMTPQQIEGVAEGVKVSPPAIIGGLSIMGIEINQLILIGTLIYTILLVLHKAFHMYKDIYKFKNDLPDTKKGDLDD